MFDNLLDAINKPHDVEAAVAELIQGITAELQQAAGDPTRIGEISAWLQENLSVIADAIASEEDAAGPKPRKTKHGPVRHA